MTEQLKFLDKILIWTGGPKALVARAGKGSGHPRTDTKKYAIELLVENIEVAIAAPLKQLFADHLDLVEETFQLSEGEPPEDPIDLEIWETGLFEETVKALQGDTVDTIGAEALKAWFEDNDDSELLAKRVFDALTAEPARLLHLTRITTEDIEALVGKLTAPAATPVAAPPPPPSGRRHRAPSVDRSPYTKALQLALENLINPGPREIEVANALGVSRPQALNYRTGKTLLKATPQQLEALKGLFDETSQRLQAAWRQLEEASLG